MVHIPYDVWLVIIQFLPEKVVQALLGLNRTCFGIVMDRRYRVVNLDFRSGDAKPHRYLHFQGPHVAQRVRILHISFLRPRLREPEILHRRLVGKMADTAKQALFKRSRFTHSSTTSSFQMTPELIDDLAHTLSGMSALTELHFHYDAPGENSFPLVSITRSVLGPNLQYLSLSGTLENISDALRFPASFEVLECMALHLLGPVDLSLDPNRLAIISQRIASFINGHRATLQDLELTYKFKFDTPSELSLVLDGLGYFSCLHTFCLQASLDSVLGVPALRNLILAHQHQLVTLVITHRLPATFWDGIALPKLESLNMAMKAEGPRIVEAIIALLTSLEPSLVGFKLRADYQLSDQELYSILGVFTSQSKLRRLALPVDFLSLRVLDFVAEHLPQLQLKLVNSHFIVG